MSCSETSSGATEMRCCAVAVGDATDEVSASGCVAPKKARVVVSSGVPQWLLEDSELKEAISVLPSNYDFELPKTIWKLVSEWSDCRRVALQMPEGLLRYAAVVSDIIVRFVSALRLEMPMATRCAVECVILADVTYGACNIDDSTALALRCDALVHYGHSCLVPLTVTSARLKILYVFVQMAICVKHLRASIVGSLPPSTRLLLCGTVQFAAGVQHCAALLKRQFAEVCVPRASPLSPSEVLGCTSPLLKEHYDACVFVADGRFHMESLMIANHSRVARFLRYNPYDQKLTEERYDFAQMHAIRRGEIQRAMESSMSQPMAESKSGEWIVILGTLGRQGNSGILQRICALAKQRYAKEAYCVLLSEISPQKLSQLCSAEARDVAAVVQIACPRLSIDWGKDVCTQRSLPPLLNAYEAVCALRAMKDWSESEYPMDYYRKGGGIWSNYYATAEDRLREKHARLERRRRRKTLRKAKLKLDSLS